MTCLIIVIIIVYILIIVPKSFGRLMEVRGMMQKVAKDFLTGILLYVWIPMVWFYS